MSTRQEAVLTSLRRLYHHLVNGGQFHERIDSERLSLAIKYIEEHSHSDRLIRAEAFNAGWNARGDHEADKAAGKATLPRHKWFDYWMSKISSGA